MICPNCGIKHTGIEPVQGNGEYSTDNGAQTICWGQHGGVWLPRTIEISCDRCNYVSPVDPDFDS